MDQKWVMHPVPDSWTGSSWSQNHARHEVYLTCVHFFQLLLVYPEWSECPYSANLFITSRACVKPAHRPADAPGCS